MKYTDRFMTRLLRTLVLLAGPFWVGLGTAIAGVDELLQRLPASSCLVLASHDTSATCAAFQSTALGAKFCGEEFAPLVQALRESNRGSPLHLRPWIGLDWPALAELESSSVLAAVPLKDGSAGIVWLMDEQASKDALEKSVRAYYTAQRWGIVEKQLGNSSATTFSPPAGVKQSPRIWFTGPGYYGMANSSAALTAVLATRQGESFASRDIAKSLVAHSDESPGDVTFYVEPLVLWKALEAPPPGKKLPLKEPVLAAERLGFGGIQQASGTIKLSTAGADEWQLVAQLVIPQPYPKALKMLEMLPGERLTLPAWIGDDVAEVSHWRWDFVQGMQAFGHLFDEATDPGPDGAGLFEQVLDGLRDDPEGPRVDMRTELFPKLGPEVTTISSPGKTLTLVRIAPEHMPALRDFVKRVYENDELVEFQKIGEFQLWSGKENLPIFADAGEPNESSIRAMALGYDQLWVATSTPWLKEIMGQVAEDKVASALVKAPAWRDYVRLRSRLANELTVYESFARSSVSWRSSYAAATKPLAARQRDDSATRAWHFLLFGTTRRDANVPYTAAPSFERWGKDLPATGTFLSRTKTGAELILSPVSPEK